MKRIVVSLLCAFSLFGSLRAQENAEAQLLSLYNSCHQFNGVRARSQIVLQPYAYNYIGTLGFLPGTVFSWGDVELRFVFDKEAEKPHKIYVLNHGQNPVYIDFMQSARGYGDKLKPYKKSFRKRFPERVQALQPGEAFVLEEMQLSLGVPLSQPLGVGEYRTISPDEAQDDCFVSRVVFTTEKAGGEWISLQLKVFVKELQDCSARLTPAQALPYIDGSDEFTIPVTGFY